MTPFVLALALLTEGDREADMFGEDAKAPAATNSDALEPDERELAPPHSELLTNEDNALAIGGQLFLRLNAALRQDDTLATMPLLSPSLVDLFADVRPNDRVRGFAQLRLTYDFAAAAADGLPAAAALPPAAAVAGGSEGGELLLDQLWIKLDLGRVAFLTVGRQRIRWGTGRFWNPTDFINTEIRNSVDFFDQRLGVNLLKVHFPFEQLGWNLYLLGTLDNVDAPEEAGMAARAEFLFSEVELAVSTLLRKDAPLRFGLDASAGVWLLDVRGEMSIQRGLGRPKFAGDLDFAKGVFPQTIDTDDDFFFQGVFGGDLTLKYTDQDNVILGGEYFYNQAGYANAKLYPFLALNGAFTPLFLAQHYVAGYAILPQPFACNDTSITLSTIANLSDLSVLTRLDVQHGLLTYLTLNVFAGIHWGNVGELRIGFEVPPVPPLLPEGIDVPTQIFDAGVALRVAL